MAVNDKGGDVDLNQAESTRRLHREWLPTYCIDAKRQYDPDGFKPESIKVTSDDARDFMRVLDAGVVWDIGGCRFRAHRSSCRESLFWEGSKAKTPRSITLFMEPVVTIAWMASSTWTTAGQPRTWACSRRDGSLTW